MLIINLSLLGSNIPFFFRVGAPLLVLVILAVIFLMGGTTGKRIVQTVVLTIMCIIAAAVSDPIAAFWLRTGGVLVSILLSVFSYYYIDENCTSDFKNECWKGIMADLSLTTVVGMAIAQYFVASFWVFLVIYLVSLLYAYYTVVGFTVSGYNTAILTSNEDQRNLFRINDDEI